jgi:hypothetical protein
VLTPTEALESTENALRLIVRLLLPDWQAKVTEQRLQQFKDRQAEEGKRRDGVATSNDLLPFTDFTDLTRLVLGEWETFKPVFDDQARLKVYFSLFEDVRNSIAHSRPLVDFEQELLSGMATQLRNQIGLFRMDANPATKHYPVIESAIDSYGVEGVTNVSWSGTIRVEVGHTIEFTGRAVDPRGRELEWFLGHAGQPYETALINHIETEAIAVGNSVRLPMTITEVDVCEYRLVAVMMRTKDYRFHRHNDVFRLGNASGVLSTFHYDDVRLFTYAVNPPMD